MDTSSSTSSEWFHENPHHPRLFNQPIRRSFQPCWFNTWSWLHYDEGNGTVLFFCGKVKQEGLLKVNCKDVVFASKGFANWN